MAYLAEFWDSSRPQGAMMPLTRFHLGRRDLSESHSPTCRPAWNSPTDPVIGEAGVASVLQEPGLLLRRGPQCYRWDFFKTARLLRRRQAPSPPGWITIPGVSCCGCRTTGPKRRDYLQHVLGQLLLKTAAAPPGG